MKTIKYYNKNSNVVAYKKVIYYDDGRCVERTYDNKGQLLTYKDSFGYYKVKDKWVTKEKFESFNNASENPILSKIIKLKDFLAELGKQLKKLIK